MKMEATGDHLFFFDFMKVAAIGWMCLLHLIKFFQKFKKFFKLSGNC